MRMVQFRDDDEGDPQVGAAEARSRENESRILSPAFLRQVGVVLVRHHDGVDDLNHAI